MMGWPKGRDLPPSACCCLFGDGGLKRRRLENDNETEPNNESPLNGQAAALWPNQEEFRKVLLKKHREAGGKTT